MKYKILISIALLTIVVMFLDTENEAHSYANGAYPAVSGSPGDNASCNKSGCHSQYALNSSIGTTLITSTIPATGYVAGTTYTITASCNYSGRVRFGFELSPQNSIGNLVGEMTVTNMIETKLICGGKYITHNLGGTLGAGGRTWTFDWTAPPSGSGNGKFYASFNCADNMNNYNGDYIYTDSLSFSEMISTGNDCGIFEINIPSSFDCSGTFSPVVVLGNYGTSILDSCLIYYQIDASTPSVYHFMGPLASGAKTVVTLPLVASISGTHTFTAFTDLPNDSMDVVHSNDNNTKNYTTTLSSYSMPFFEGFETVTFPPTDWSLFNTSYSLGWARNLAAHKTGSASAKMDYFNDSSGIGQRDVLQTPPMNLTTHLSPKLFFQVAYRVYSTMSSNDWDSLKVFISTDCGLNWNQIYSKTGTTLASVSGAQTSAFTPTSTQWRQETVNLSAYSTCTNAILKFVAGGKYGNNIYLDDINIYGDLGLSDPENNLLSINLFPNPVNEYLILEYIISKNSTFNISVFDIQGRKITELISEKNKLSGKYKTTLETKQFKSGVYFVTITDGSIYQTKKLIINH